MSNVIQDRFNFLTDGLNSELTEDQKEKIINIAEELSIYNESLKEIDEKIGSLAEKYDNVKKYFTTSGGTAKGQKLFRNMYSFNYDYRLNDQLDIFKCNGKFGNIWFLNKEYKLCLIYSSKLVNNRIFLGLRIGCKDINTFKSVAFLSLDRFLNLYENKEFKITNKKFVDNCLKKPSESNSFKLYYKDLFESKIKLEIVINSIKNTDFYQEMDSKYNIEKCILNNDYYNIRSKLSRDISPIEATKKRNKKIKLDNKYKELKNLWNSTVSDSDKAYLLGWLCKHVKKITIKVVDKGVSDKIISEAYPDIIYGKKYREKANSSGWDASSGKLSLDTTKNLPLQTLKSLSTIKHLQHSKDDNKTLENNYISNLDFCLFILSKYNKYGFKSGIKNLNKLIDVESLKNNEFKDNIKSFEVGYNS